MAQHEKKAQRVKGDVRKRQIVQAALRIIAQYGLKALTTAAIAQEVGISEPALYRHFENKEAILNATVEQIGAGLAKNAGNVLSMPDISALKKIKKLFMLHLDYIEKNKGIPRLVFSEELHMGSHQLKEKLLLAIGAYASRIEALIREGKKNGTIKRTVDPAASTLMFVGIMQVLALKWSLSGFAFSLSREGKKLWKSYEQFLSSGSSP